MQLLATILKKDINELEIVQKCATTLVKRMEELHSKVGVIFSGKKTFVRGYFYSL